MSNIWLTVCVYGAEGRLPSKPNQTRVLAAIKSAFKHISLGDVVVNSRGTITDTGGAGSTGDDKQRGRDLNNPRRYI